MINPSEIDLNKLPWLPLDARSAFPRQPAIYFAIDKSNCIQYIGKSIDPKMRWAQHHRYEDLQASGFIRIVYLFVDSVELLSQIESALIAWFKPPLNVTGVTLPSKKSTDQRALGMKRLRERVGKTALQIAGELNIAKSTVNNWDQLKYPPRMTATGFQRLMEVYECTFEELMEAEGEVKRDN